MRCTIYTHALYVLDCVLRLETKKKNNEAKIITRVPQEGRVKNRTPYSHIHQSVFGQHCVVVLNRFQTSYKIANVFSIWLFCPIFQSFACLKLPTLHNQKSKLVLWHFGTFFSLSVKEVLKSQCLFLILKIEFEVFSANIISSSGIV